ncbi:MAG: cytochrome C oxidase subunit IV family protein [Bdellovibrionota bacterium]|nr:cytochrome C oxidase subunit IV family protein [Bdellovibrionota bacterium]
MAHHIVPLNTNIKTLAALVVLTAVTVLTAKFIHLGGAGNLILAMFIACCKAGIVLSWFMHLKYDGMSNRVIALCGLAFLALFIGFSAVDLCSRNQGGQNQYSCGFSTEK